MYGSSFTRVGGGGVEETSSQSYNEIKSPVLIGLTMLGGGSEARMTQFTVAIQNLLPYGVRTLWLIFYLEDMLWPNSIESGQSVGREGRGGASLFSSRCLSNFENQRFSSASKENKTTFFI